jgi:hypothetical protein
MEILFTVRPAKSGAGPPLSFVLTDGIVVAIIQFIG